MAAYPQLADLGYRQIRPPACLRPFVQCYWVMQGMVAARIIRQELLHPDGGTGLNINLGDEITMDGQLRVQGIRFDGTSARTYALEMAGRMDSVGVRFLPGGAHRLLGLPMEELAQHNVDARDVLPELGGSWLERFAEIPTAEGRLQRLEQVLLRRLAVAGDPSLATQQALAAITRTRGQGRIQSLAGQIGVSSRHLERMFLRHVGLSPKTFARVVRVRYAREAIKRDKGDALVDIALDGGFFDQAHFVRDFKAVVGMPPTAYRRRRLSGQ